MTLRTRIEPIETFIRAVVRDDLSPQAQSKAVAQFARDRITEAKDKNRQVLGRVPPHKVFVDGREGAALESVRPDGGTIIVEFELIADVIKTVLAELRAASPIVSGAYRDGHTLFINGVAVPDVPKEIKGGDEIMIANPVPYARRIEIGVTKAGRAFVIQVAPRVYDRVAKAMQARFANSVKIKTDGGAGVLLSTAASIRGVSGRFGVSTHYQSLGKRKRRRLHGGEQVKSPAIFITSN